MDSAFTTPLSHLYNATPGALAMRTQKPLVIKLVIIAFLMFGFSFALVPLYNVFCTLTGLNGKINIQKRYKDAELSALPATERLVTVEFDTNQNHYLPCEFSPEHTALQVIPGKMTVTSYFVKNLTSKQMVIQAIPSISPGIAAQYLKKLECFCFDRQTLKPGESLQLPLRFWLETDLPKGIHRLTLSYTLFDVTNPRTEAKKE